MSTRQFCVRWGCTNGASYDKPLCYPHWLEWDAGELEECSRCHWFYTFDEFILFDAGEEEGYTEVKSLCDNCVLFTMQPPKEPERPVDPSLGRFNYEKQELQDRPPCVHSPLVPITRYVYILKLADNSLYVGQTTDLKIRLQEHKEGHQWYTKGKNPRLVYFEEALGGKRNTNRREQELTEWNKTGKGRRMLRIMIENFRAPLRLLDLEA